MNWAYLRTVLIVTALLVGFLAAVILAGAWARARYSRRAREHRRRQELEKAGRDLLALPPEEAGRRALERVRTSPDFETVRAAAPLGRSDLGPALLALFDEFAEIHYLPDNSYLSRAALNPHADDPAWLRIGKDGEQDWLLVRPGQDEVVVAAAQAEDPADRMAERYPTVHHWLLSLSAD